MDETLTLQGSKVNKVAGYSVLAICLAYPLFFLGGYRLHATVLVAALMLGYQICRESYPIKQLISDLIPGLPVYMFFALALLSAIWADYPEPTLRLGVAHLLLPFVTGLTLLASKERPPNWLYALVITLPYLILGTFVGFLVRFGSVRPNSAEMLKVVGSQSNLFVFMVVICIPFLIYLFYRTGGLIRVAVGGAFIASITSVTLAESAVSTGLSIFALVLSGTVLGHNWSRRALSLLKMCMVTLLIVGVTLLAVNMPSIISEFTQNPQEVVNSDKGVDRGGSLEANSSENNVAEDGEPQKTSQESSESTGSAAGLSEAAEDSTLVKAIGKARILQYQEGMEAIKENPVFGLGYNNLRPRMIDLYGMSVGSHNIVITAWGELGIWGMALVSWIIVAALFSIRQARGDSLRKVSGISFIMALAYGMVQPLFGVLLFYVVLAFLLQSLRMQRARGGESSMSR